METKKKDEEEKRRRALDQKKLKKLKQKDLPKAIETISKSSDQNILQFKTKLILPPSQISESDFKMISKYAQGLSGNIP